MTEEAKTEKNQSNTLSRKSFIKLLLTGGAAAALSACDITPEEKKEIPQIALEDLIKQPDLYSGIPLFKTHGYPEEIGEDTISVPIIYFMKVGNVQVPVINWISTKTEIYKLHTVSDKESPSLDFMVSESTYFPSVPLEPEGRNLLIKDLYELTGKIGKVKITEDNKVVEKYILQPEDVIMEEIKTP